MRSNCQRLSITVFVPLIIIFIVWLFAGTRTRATFRLATLAAQPDQAVRERISRNYGQLPLQFESNRGQTDPRVKFLARGSGYSLFLGADEAVLKLRGAGSRISMKLADANLNPVISGTDRLDAKSHYFLGADPRAWRTNVATFAQVKYESVYPGIDLIWYGNQRQIEHDFVAAPGANPRRIKLAFTDARGLKITPDGALNLKVEEGELRFLKPVAWQESGGERIPVECDFSIDAQGRVGFRLGSYDTRKPLVIDPVLLYSTYLGGGTGELGLAITLDKDRNAYITGATNSPDFPYTSPTQPPPANNGDDVFVLKLNPAGNAVVYSTWFGGSGTDVGYGIAVDNDGAAYVTGLTFSTNFPTTTGSLQPAPNRGSEAFVTKLDPSGSAIVYSTYLGGNSADGRLGSPMERSPG